MSKKGTAVSYIFLSIMAFLIISPLYILVVNSFKSQTEIIDTPLALPLEFTFQYIVEAYHRMEYLSSIIVTIGITVSSVFLIVMISSLTAWILVRTKTRVSSVIFMFFVAAMLIPFQAIMFPLISLFEDMGLKNIPGLVVMYAGFGLSMSIFLYHGFVKGIPVSIEEATIIDGANIGQLFLKVVFPLLKPVTVTVIILNAMWIWNDYLLPFLTIGNSEHKTLVLSLYFKVSEAGQYGNPWEFIFPAVLITIIPMVIIFLSLQKHFIKGISDGAVKS